MQDRQLTLPDIWQILWRRKLWLLLPVVLVAAVAFGGSYLLPVVYESSTKIIISSTKLVSPELERMLPTELGGVPSSRRLLSDWLASTRSEIRSTDYINTLITDLGLQTGDAIIKQASKMQEQFPDYDLRTIIRKLQIDQLRDKIDVELLGRSQIIITCSSDNPKLANEMATKLAAVYREKKLAEEVRSARESQLFTDQQFSLAQREYEDAEAELVRFQNSYIADRLDQGISSQGNLNQIDSEIDAVRLDIMEAADRRNFLLAEMLTAGMDTTAVAVDFPSLRVYVDDALHNTREIASLLNKYVWRDAKVQGLQSKVGYSLEDMRDAAGEIAASHYPTSGSGLQQVVGNLVYRTYQIKFLEGKEQLLRDAIDKIKSVLANSPYYDQMTDRLQREVDEKKNTYNKWANQAAGIKILQATTAAEAESKYRILEPASIPLEPASPNRLKISLMGLALGLLLGCCAVVVAELLDHSIRSIEEVEQILGYEVIGTIPRIEPPSRVSRNTSVKEGQM
jgi:uncharacterized protein involved in exopolysaccharide biosynthesis